jgi:hypothetical protein
MPASRILEGSLPERHPKAQIFSAPKHNPKRSQSGISRAKPLASQFIGKHSLIDRLQAFSAIDISSEMRFPGYTVTTVR